MATLSTGSTDELSFEINYSGFDDDWIKYQFNFRWRGDNIVRESVLKKGGDYWSNRPDGAFLANEHGYEGLTRLLKKVLEQNKADYWEAIEPDILVAIYPDEFFPFLPSHYQLVRESETFKAQRKVRKKLKQERGNLPDDLFTFIIFVDAYNLEHAVAYLGSGLSLQMIVTREKLEAFLGALQMEYQAFKQKFRIDEWIENE